MGEQRQTRRPKQQAVLEVQGKQQLTDHLVRLVLGGADFPKIAPNGFTDAYVKLLLPRPGSTLAPPFDLEQLRATAPDQLPTKRTYTVRRWDLENQQLWIDVVLHTNDAHAGIASAWAASCLPGDTIALVGPGGGYFPRAEAAFHLFIGDLAAAPAIAAALESLPEGAEGVALIQVENSDDRILNLDHPDGVNVTWVVGKEHRLLDAVRRLSVPQVLIDDRRIHVFCHAERGLTKALRQHLIQERGIERGDVSISAYWAKGRVEDQFQAEKKEPIGRID